MNYTISRYGISNQYTLTTHGTNPSSIITKMIHLTGRLCEYYASDIVFEAVNFRNAVERHKPYRKYLFFREQGVEAFEPNEVEYIQGTDYIQAWELRFNPHGEGTQTFQRICVRQE